MAIINSKEGTLRPFLSLSVFRLDYIENDGNSVFIVVSHYSLIGVCSVTFYNSISLDGALGWFIVRYDDSLGWLKSYFVFFICHELERIRVFGGLRDFRRCLTQIYKPSFRPLCLISLQTWSRIGDGNFRCRWNLNHQILSFAKEGHMLLLGLPFRLFPFF